MTHDEFQDLAEAARRLPRSIEPERDLWPGIEARLDETVEEPPAGRIVRPDFAFGRRGWLAAAAVLVACVAALSTGVLRRDHSGAGGGSAIVEADRPVTASLDAIDATHASASRDVLAALSRNRDLDPETVELIRRNLEIIENAIAEIRAALADDPENPGLNRLLTAEYQRRGEVLRRAAKLTDSI